ncbi:MAG: hypothetical protein RLZZ511_1370 [Cyanobacteriota bacterium]
MRFWSRRRWWVAFSICSGRLMARNLWQSRSASCRFHIFCRDRSVYCGAGTGWRTGNLGEMTLPPRLSRCSRAKSRRLSVSAWRMPQMGMRVLAMRASPPQMPGIFSMPVQVLLRLWTRIWMAWAFSVRERERSWVWRSWSGLAVANAGVASSVACIVGWAMGWPIAVTISLRAVDRIDHGRQSRTKSRYHRRVVQRPGILD